MFYTPEQMGITQEEVNEICERLYKERMDGANSTCPDCAVGPGEKHDPNCDVARCTECGTQRLSCGCDKGETDSWSGLWPGIQECYDQKLIAYDTAMGLNHWCFDLNKLHENKVKQNQK